MHTRKNFDRLLFVGLLFLPIFSTVLHATSSYATPTTATTSGLDSTTDPLYIASTGIPVIVITGSSKETEFKGPMLADGSIQVSGAAQISGLTTLSGGVTGLTNFVASTNTTTAWINATNGYAQFANISTPTLSSTSSTTLGGTTNITGAISIGANGSATSTSINGAVSFSSTPSFNAGLNVAANQDINIGASSMTSSTIDTANGVSAAPICGSTEALTKTGASTYSCVSIANLQGIGTAIATTCPAGYASVWNGTSLGCVALPATPSIPATTCGTGYASQWNGNTFACVALAPPTSQGMPLYVKGISFSGANFAASINQAVYNGTATFYSNTGQGANFRDAIGWQTVCKIASNGDATGLNSFLGTGPNSGGGNNGMSCMKFACEGVNGPVGGDTNGWPRFASWGGGCPADTLDCPGDNAGSLVIDCLDSQ